MALLRDADLLQALEEGSTLAPAARLLPLLALISDDKLDELAALPIGERDRRLLAIRTRLFGSRFVGLCRCARCDEIVELAFDAAMFPTHDGKVIRQITVRDRDVRMPTTFDLIAAATAGEIDDARSVLIARCIGIDDDAGFLEEAGAELAACDAFLAISLAAACMRCASAVDVAFDIEAYLWSELDAWSRRALETVATLARAFGWSERDILDMTPWRREAYLRIAAA